MQRTDEDALSEAIIQLASEYGRYGYRRPAACEVLFFRDPTITLAITGCDIHKFASRDCLFLLCEDAPHLVES
jgi:hypothetical protein